MKEDDGLGGWELSNSILYVFISQCSIESLSLNLKDTTLHCILLGEQSDVAHCQAISRNKVSRQRTESTMNFSPIWATGSMFSIYVRICNRTISSRKLGNAAIREHITLFVAK